MRRISIAWLAVLVIVLAAGCSRSQLCSVSDPDFRGRYNNCLFGVAAYGETDKAKEKELALDRKIKERNHPTSQPGKK